MKKTALFISFFRRRNKLKILLAMRLTVFLMLVVTIQVSAKGYAQEKISVSFENVRLDKALKIVEKKSDFHFVYSNLVLNEKSKVTISANNIEVLTLLEKMLRNTGLTFNVLHNNLVVIKGIEQTIRDIHVTGKVTDASTGNPLSGVSIQIKGSTAGTSSDNEGNFSIDVPDDAVLVVTSVGYNSFEVHVNGKTKIDITLTPSITGLNEVVVVGYGTQKRKDITSSVSSITSKDFENVNGGGSSISSKLAGKLGGLSFRQAESRPGAAAQINVRNMGTPLYVVDGIIENAGRFNQLDPNDIESISVLKDASAASVYGVQAGNGVIVITTKKGKLGVPLKVNVNGWYGWQNLTRYPNDVVDAYHWNLYAAEAQMNSNGVTGITQEEIDKWKAGTEYGYQSFDWTDMIFKRNAPQASFNINASGGSDRTNYYFSFSRLKQDAVFKEYGYNRYNVISNLSSLVGKKKRLKIALNFNGKIEERMNPGIPGVDDYQQPLVATLRNRPMYHAFANDNPEYLNDIGFNNTNAGLWTYERSGKYQDRWWAMATQFALSYTSPIKGLTANAFFNFTYEDELLTNHEKRFNAYTYNPNDSTYNITSVKPNAWQERGTQKNFRKNFQGQINYSRNFNSHTIDAMVATTWLSNESLVTHIHAVPPTDELDQFVFNTIDDNGFVDDKIEEARIGYIARLNYNFKNKYYLELSGRADASWKFPPDKRWGFFPAFSAGWRLSSEPFFKSLLNSDNSNDLKLRVSYGVLGNDNIGIGSFAYVSGYNFNVGSFIKDGTAVTTSRYRGFPVTNITWFTSNMLNLGLDFKFGNLSGAVDFFNRERRGLLAQRYDLLLPNEIGYTLPEENLNSDVVVGEELSLAYSNNWGEVHYEIYGNVNYAREKTLHTYKPKWGNSWDYYRNSVEERYKNIFWGYQAIGQFQSQEEINKYPVNIDGLGNTSLLPGDLIYEDVNNDGFINEYDMRPIGSNKGNQPSVYGGFGLNIEWKRIDFAVEFSYGGGYAVFRNGWARIPFFNDGNLLNDFTDRWHREDIFDLNSEWIPGKGVPLRYNDNSHSNYNKPSTYWLTNVRYLRARTFAIGYTLPEKWGQRLGMNKTRVYVNTYNLFTLDNLSKHANFLDPEVDLDNALQYPQSRLVNIGVNISF